MIPKIQLPTVTLIIIDCINADKAIKVIEHCKKLCDFGNIKFLTSIPVEYEHRVKIMPLNSLVSYSIFMLTRFSEHIQTEHCLIVQCDGWVLNPESFNFSWLELDFIGPLFMQYDKVGSGGFSLRSKRLMDYCTQIMPKWDGTQKDADRIQEGLGYYEDGEISLSGKFNQFKIATLEQSANFAQGGNRNPNYFRERPFGYHRTWQTIDFKTGIVDSSDTSKDIHVSYDHEIEELI